MMDLEELCGKIWNNEDRNYQKALNIVCDSIDSDELDSSLNDMADSTKVELVRNFIFNNDVQKTLNQISNCVIDLNILDIIGMGTQEIKHSNILAWLFDNREHQLGYGVLDSFLIKVINNEKNLGIKDKTSLLSYIFLADKKRDIEIYREKDNIDLLIVDQANKIVIVIENKLLAEESETQLKDYETKVNDRFSAYDTKCFIFLTPELRPPKKRTVWMIANYEMIVEGLRDLLNIKKDLDIKVKIIIESYIDLLERKSIVQNIKLKGLTDELWKEEEYQKAIFILNDYQPNKELEIAHYVRKYITEHLKLESKGTGKKTIFNDKYMDEDIIGYEFRSDVKGMPLTLVLGEVKEENREKCNKIYEIVKGKKHKSPDTWRWTGLGRVNLFEGDIEDTSLEAIIKIVLDRFKSAYESLRKETDKVTQT